MDLCLLSLFASVIVSLTRLPGGVLTVGTGSRPNVSAFHTRSCPKYRKLLAIASMPPTVTATSIRRVNTNTRTVVVSVATMRHESDLANDRIVLSLNMVSNANKKSPGYLPGLQSCAFYRVLSDEAVSTRHDRRHGGPQGPPYNRNRRS